MNRKELIAHLFAEWRAKVLDENSTQSEIDELFIRQSKQLREGKL